MSKKGKILVVDDEAFNLDILCEYLEGAGYDLVQADDGDVALERLAENPDVDVIVLDRMMPRMDGLTVVKELKKDPKWQSIPVVMQTAAAQTSHMLEGIQSGVFYYLTKPYEEEMLLAVVESALNFSKSLKNLNDDLEVVKSQSKLLEKAHFKFRTLEEAKSISNFVSKLSKDSTSAYYGISEIALNAIEHGNLGINEEEKSHHLTHKTFYDEIKKRLEDPAYKSKVAELFLDASDPNQIRITIKDQGKGFNPEKYMDIDPVRMLKPNGRGIATARMLAFSDIKYNDVGNEVVCTLRQD